MKEMDRAEQAFIIAGEQQKEYMVKDFGSKGTKKTAIDVEIKIDTKEMDKAIKKTKKLIKLLKKANRLTENLKIDDEL